MIAVPFDTLSMARKLQASGMDGVMASGTVDVIVDALSGAALATKADLAATTASIDALRTEVKGDIDSLRTELKTEIGILRTELKTEIAGIRTEVKTEVAGLRTEVKTEIATLHTQMKTDNATLRTEFKSDIELLRRDLVIKCGGMMVIGVGVMLTAMRFLLLHP